MDAGIADILVAKSFTKIIAILLGLSEHDSFVVSLHLQDNFFQSLRGEKEKKYQFTDISSMSFKKI